MEKVTGIGGFFFKAKNPQMLAEWYETNLGVSKIPTDYDGTVWEQEAGTTVFGGFDDEAGLLGPNQAWMINFRVSALDAMVKQLQDAGIKVEVDPETYPNGRFASLSDPEGNPIQLWEPQE